jgi:hypothetical protein
MANIDRIVNVQISLRTAAITTMSFSDLLLIGTFVPQAGEHVAIITAADELIDSYGVVATDPLYLAAQVAFSQIPTVPQIYIGLKYATDTPTDVMAAINGENTDWYAMCDVMHNEAETMEFAAWAEANNKLFVTVLSDPGNTAPPATDTTSIGAQLKAGNFFRTAWWWNPDPLKFTDVAITCRSFTKYPGGETWANQRLSATTVTNLNETTANNIFGKNGNTFEPFRNIAITQNGKVAGGEWIDVIRFRDWLCEEIRLRVFSQMIDNRIPYTDPGIAIIRSRIAQALDFGVVRGGIAPPEVNADGKVVPSYVIQVPLSMNVSFNNKANRILQDVYFTARLAGAIHVVEIKGTLTYTDLTDSMYASAA